MTWGERHDLRSPVDRYRDEVIGQARRWRRERTTAAEERLCAALDALAEAELDIPARPLLEETGRPSGW